MFQYLFDSIAGVEIFPIISLILFFGLFIGIVVWAIRADKDYLKKMEELPLDVSNNNGEQNNG
jgi:cytochrome c oxidase cbb3-type subunit IV